MAAYFLRLVSIVQILTVVIVLLPQSWIASGHAWAGFGVMPQSPFLIYVLRGAAYCQGAIGILLWIIAGDLVRYRPLVIATGFIYLLGGPVFYLIDGNAGVPRWWQLMDSISCFLVGGVLLALVYWERRRSS